MNQSNEPIKNFESLSIDLKLKQLLAKNNFTTPSPIQAQCIPLALTGADIMGIAQTGTGKTLAFGIPLLQHLLTQKQGSGLIIAPTRELAVQIEKSLSPFCRHLKLKTVVIIGGDNMNRQIQTLRNQPHIVICTPGRLIDHMQQKTIHLKNITLLVLDEADRMLDMGFAPQLKQIAQQLPTQRQTMLFSATMPHSIQAVASQYLRTPLRVEIAPAGTAAKNVTQEIFFVQKDEKLRLLKQLLFEYNGSTLVFTRTKFGAKKIAASLRSMDVSSTEIHSNRSLNQRLAALKGFSTGQYRVLVATDIAARGIDVKDIQLVINYDLPEQLEDYVHRIGRTGRAGSSGHAISFATPDQKRDIKNIERLIKQMIPVRDTPKNLPVIEKSSEAAEHESPRFSRTSRGGFHRTSSSPRARSFNSQTSRSRGSSTAGRNSTAVEAGNGERKYSPRKKSWQHEPAPQSFSQAYEEARTTSPFRKRKSTSGPNNSFGAQNASPSFRKPRKKSTKPFQRSRFGRT